MNYYTVLYREQNQYTDLPFAFTCMADNVDHAEEQCYNAYPDCDIVWVVQTANVDAAYEDYYELL